jgi:hypothetical protein
MSSYRARRTVLVVILLLLTGIPLANASIELPTLGEVINQSKAPVRGDLAQIPVKGRAPKTGYTRQQFGDGWGTSLGCDTRNIILARDLTHVVRDQKCRVISGVLKDPYTGKDIQFVRGESTSGTVQIDHVVALSNAWQTGAQQLTPERRIQLANDPLNLLAVDGPSNENKSDGDAATWLPPNKPFRCQYVARQISVKLKYGLWVTPAERDAMATILQKC